MKILHTSDWHLGKKLGHISRLAEQQRVLQEICDIVDQQSVDAVIIAGDLFDTFNPPVEAIELFYSTLKKLGNQGKRPVIAIAGNHDSPDRIEAPHALAHESGIIFVGYPHTHIPTFSTYQGFEVEQSEQGFIKITLPNKNPLCLLLTAFANEFRLKTYLNPDNSKQSVRNMLAQSWQQLADQHCSEESINLLISHLLMYQSAKHPLQEPDNEKPIEQISEPVFTNNLPPQLDYVALGHLHRFQTIENLICPVVYSGSPLAYSFSESFQKKYVILLEFDQNKQLEIKPIELKTPKKLIRKRFMQVKEAVKWLKTQQNMIVELTIQTEQYLTAKDRKALHDAYDDLFVIPDVQSTDLFDQAQNKTKHILENFHNMDHLFMSYFHTKHGQTPNKDILDLFSELLAGEQHDSN
ncbi:exonuclease subunit SbcD [Candidatus Albibeggiatoa sp. nov. NOAA]|uniref:metallophosphoesterase family protein n=1 Tax=Candidatus Albibeggiatoa sp. nov. NOAA TaxID=3162724 RepID=UPI0032F4AB5A|nr:exonuclease subunit SbcD [Thiotrichaceae bacterium]